jgi:transposase
MGDTTTIGLDLAKNVFQVDAVDQAASVVMRKRLRRGQVLAFFAEIFRRASSGWKPARRRIIGRAS